MDGPAAVRERVEAFAELVMAGAVNRPVQVVNGQLYLRGLIEQGARKSLEPMVERLGEEADYQSLQQFIAVSPWDPAVVMRNVAECGDLGTAHAARTRGAAKLGDEAAERATCTALGGA